MKAKLSNRVRPDCEAAPWVIEEIKLLEAENDRLKYNLNNEEENSRLFCNQRDGALAENLQLREALEEIKEEFSGIDMLQGSGATVWKIAAIALNDTPNTAALAELVEAAIEFSNSPEPWNGMTTAEKNLREICRKCQEVKCHHRFTKPLNDNSVCVDCGIPYRKLQEVKR